MASLNGNYAVIVSNMNCTDTSDCINISNVGFDNFSYLDKSNVFPNPFSDIVNVKFGSNSVYKSISICDVYGKLCYQQEIHSEKDIKVQFTGKTGVYLMENKSKNESEFFRLIKYE